MSDVRTRSGSFLVESEFFQKPGTAIQDILRFPLILGFRVPFTLLLASLLFSVPRRSGEVVGFCSLRARRAADFGFRESGTSCSGCISWASYSHS